MKTGIRNYYIDRYGLDEGARLMAEHGYAYIDLQFTNTETEYYSAREEDFIEKIYAIKKGLAKHGISVSQIHGPWRIPQDATEDDRAERFGKMTKAMVIAKHLGAKYMAVHPLMPYGANSPHNPEEVYAINKKYYEALAKVGAGLGVTVCLENMPFQDFPLSSCESIIKLVKDIDHPNLKICFDTGHANLIGERSGDCVRAIGDLLKILHLHDNDGTEDTHLPPYDGNFDWADFIEGLYDIGYDGVMSLETEPIKEKDKALSPEEITARELSLAKYAKLLAE